MEGFIEHGRWPQDRRAGRGGRSSTERCRPSDETVHDLRAPLAAAVGRAELLARTLSTRLSEVEQLAVALLIQDILRADALVRETFSPNHQANANLVDLHEVVMDVIAMYADELDTAEATVAVGRLGRVPGDELQLSRVAQNLIGNAIKFRRRDVALEVSIWGIEAEDEWIVTVEDNGTGIPPHTRERVFSFARCGSDHTPGTGLGLSICRRIIGEHGGRIWIESGPVGTAICFALPTMGVDPATPLTHDTENHQARAT